MEAIIPKLGAEVHKKMFIFIKCDYILTNVNHRCVITGLAQYSLCVPEHEDRAAAK